MLSYVSSAFATRSTSGRGNPSAEPTSRTADRARYVTRLQTIPVCSGPYFPYTYWITSSRRSELKSMSTSGYAVRPSLMNRSNSSSWRIGSTRAMPST